MRLRDRPEVGDTVEIAIGDVPDLSWRQATVLSINRDDTIGVRTNGAHPLRYDSIPPARYKVSSRSRDWLLRRFEEVM